MNQIMESSRGKQTDRSNCALKIDCFGQFRVRLFGNLVNIKSVKIRVLLAALVCSPQMRVDRLSLARLIWGRHADENALTSLRQALVKLKREINITQPDILLANRQAIWFDLTQVSSDYYQAFHAEYIDDILFSDIKHKWHKVLFEDLECKESNIADWLLAKRFETAQHFTKLIDNRLADIENKSEEFDILQKERARIARLYSPTVPANPIRRDATSQRISGDIVVSKPEAQNFFLRNPLNSPTLESYLNYTREKVSHFWIQSVLKNKCDPSYFINLRLKQANQLIRLPYDIQQFDKNRNENTSVYNLDNFFDVFKHCHGQLLLLGEPASGKTTSILHLVAKILQCTSTMKHVAVPIVVNVASWKAAKPSFRQWLIQEIDFRYDLPPQVTDTLLQQNYFILMIDGLDEVGQPDLDSLIMQINLFVKESPGILICLNCRERDYLTGKKRLHIFAAFVLQAINRAQLNELINKNQDKHTILRDLERGHDDVRILTTPLAVRIAIKAIEDRTIQPGQFSAENMIGSWYESMLPASVEEKASSLRCLRELSIIMEKTNQSVFHMESLTGTAMLNRFWAEFARITSISIITILVATVLCILSWVHFQSLPLALLPIPFAVLGIVVVSLLGEDGEKRLLPRVVLTLSAFRREWRTKLPTTFYACISLGICSTWIFDLTQGLIITSFISILYLVWNCLDFESPTEPGYDFGKPNEIIHRSIKNATVGGIIGAITGLTADLVLATTVSTSTPYFMLAPLFAIVSFFLLGGHSVLQHYIVRLILKFSGRLPLRLGKFLNWCDKKGLLYRTGGGFLFPHSLVRRYLIGKSK